MADEQDGQAVSLLRTKFIQQFQNFLLHGHVQRGGGFITDEKPWLHGKGPGDGRPLALSAADLMGIAIRKVSRKPALSQQPLHFFAGFLPGHPDVSQALPNAVPQGPARVKGICGGLEHHLHFPIDLTKFPAFQMGNIRTIQQNASFCGIQQPGNQVHQGGLAAAAFPDDAQTLAGV